MSSSIQAGIYFDVGQRPPEHFGIIFLRADRSIGLDAVGRVIRELWSLYDGLRIGRIPELPGHQVAPGELATLIGYGANVFRRSDSGRRLPELFEGSGSFKSPLTTGGGVLVKGAGLSYAPDVAANPATEDVAIQFTASTALAVNRAIVETSHLLEAALHADTGSPVLMPTAFFTGFQRDDGRSWLGFHDGISNLRSGREREDALAIKAEGAEEDRWSWGGTYMAYLRIAVDIPAWRRIAQREQELLVGRGKLSGCPLVDIDPAGALVQRAGCPVGSSHILARGNEIFREPPIVGNKTLQMSHVQRANHHQLPVSSPDNLRIFRQGYEFLEPVGAAPGYRAGLNFVSFQDTPARLGRMLVQPEWLGRTNFGGNPNDADSAPSGAESLLSVRAAAYFLCPPVVAGEAFPGASIFPDGSTL